MDIDGSWLVSIQKVRQGSSDRRGSLKGCKARNVNSVAKVAQASASLGPKRPHPTPLCRRVRPRMVKFDAGLPPNVSKATISGRVWGRFSLFFEVASRGRLDSQREGPNLCFCWQAQYFQGFADFAEKPKIDKKRLKIAPTMLRERAA